MEEASQTARDKIHAIGSRKYLQILLSDENGLAKELVILRLFETSQGFRGSVSKPFLIGDKRPRSSEGFSKIHPLD